LNYDVLVPLLVQMLANSQEQAFTIALYMISDSVQQNDKVSPLIALSDLLELAQYSEFWNLLDQHRNLVQNVPKFDESVRNFISQVFIRSYKTVSKDFLMTSLGLNEGEFQEFKNTRDWTVVDNEIKFPQGAKPIHQKLVHENIDFSQFGQVLQTLAS